MNRRTLITWAATATSLGPFHRLRLSAALQEFPPESVVVLRSVARAVLPAALGARGIDQQVERFARWVREYRAGAQMDHGYGQPRLRYAPPSPVDTYIAQLEELNAAARAKGQTLDRLDRETQRTLLDAALKEANVDSLPPHPAGKHVVADLMALYFHSSEANDLCYRADIGRQKCRPITFVVNRPRSL
jgi:hypothetical protein